MLRNHGQLLATMSLMIAGLLPAGNALGQTPANWLGGTANWNTPASWSGGVIPNNGVPMGSTYDAFINAAGTYSVTMSTPITLTNLTMSNASATLIVSNTLSMVNNTTLTAGVIQLSSGTIMGGTVSSAGGRIAPTFNTSTLNGVTLGVNVLDMSGGRIALTNGTNFTGGPGTITLGNSSQIFISEAVTIASGTIFALGPNASVSADGGFTATLDAATTDTVTVNVLGGNSSIGGGFFGSSPNSILINKGRVQFDPATVSATLNVSASGAGSRFRNEGKLVAGSAGGANTINLNGGQYVNAGTIIAATGGIVNLNGTFTRADLGTFQNTGGTINIAGTLNNTALDLDNTTGSVSMVSGTIVGGTVSATGTARLKPTFNTSTLNGVTLGVNVLDMSAGRIALTNGTTLTGSGTMTFGNSSQIFINEAVTIPSGIIFALGPNASVSAEGGFTVNLEAATTDTVTVNILGGNSAIGAGFQAATPNSILVNKGRVQFDPATVSATLNVSASGAGSGFRNEGKLVASSSGSANTINLNGGQYVNAGTIIAATGGIVNLNGTFTRADLGTFQNTGGTINIAGTLNNTALDLDNTTGSVNMVSGTIMGGTVSATGTARLKPTFNTSTLNGVTLGVNVLDMSAGRIALTNGTALTGSGTMTFGNSSQIFISEAATISSGIIFALGPNASVSAEGGFTVNLDAATTDTVTVNILGGNSAIGGGFQAATPNSILINKGRVQFDPATVSATLSVSANGAGSRFRNEGKLVASSSGSANTINMNGGQYVNAGTIIAATGGIVNLNGTFTRADLGTFQNTGGTINIAGTLNNTALDLDNTTGSVSMVSGTIVGGTVSATGTARLKPTFNTSTLNGVSLGVNVLDMSAGRIALTNGTNFTGGPGTITFGNTSQIYISEATTIASGTVFAMGPNASVSADGGFTATLDAATTDTVTINVLGTNAAIGGGFQSSAANSILVNKGRVQFDPAVTGITLNISAQGAGSGFRNEGKLVAGSSGAVNTINLISGYTNAGTLIAATGGVINLNGTFTRAQLGTFMNTGGSINIGGTLNNTALDLDNTSGSIKLTAGTIVGGTVSAAGTARLLADGNTGNTLNGVTLTFDAIDLSPAGSRVRFTGGSALTGTGTVTLGSSSAVYLFQSNPIPSGVNFALGGSSAVSAEGVTATLAAATPAVLNLRLNAGASATIGAGLLLGGANSVLINQGTIDFAGANSTLAIVSSGTGSRVQNDGILTVNAVGSNINIGGTTTLTNNGVLAANGGTVNIPASATFTNFDTGTLTGGTYRVFSSSEINLNGRVITTVAANTTVLLDGASSVFTAANTVTTNNGSFTISNGRQHTVATFTNSGLLQVGTASGDLAKLTANVQVNSGGIVRGTGTIQGSLNVASGGTLAPGASPGILAVTGPVTMNAGASFTIELSGAALGSGYSQLNLAGGGSINLNSSTLVTNLNYAPNPGDSFTIVSGGAVTNIFSGLPQGSTVNLGIFQGTPYVATITYTGSTVVLNVPVPEPATILAACAGFGALTAGVRRCKQRRQSAA